MSSYGRDDRRGGTTTTNKNLWEDPDFAADTTTLYKGGYRYGVQWKRPHEISPKPVFIDQDISYHDMEQGALGNCWFVTAVSCLAKSPHKDILKRVVPLDQGFGAGYNGSFKFHFWRYGKWVEVKVDDRLPCYLGKLLYGQNKDNPHEYWSPLLEKAYAKLNGNYHVIDGGRIHTALVDLTGGLSEMIKLKGETSDADVVNILIKCHRMNTYIGAGVFAVTDEREARTDNGIIQGHAYSVLNVKQVSTSRGYVTLIHLRNPHGQGEWNGPWSDGSREWKTLSKADQEATDKDNGEFWISAADLNENFNELELVHMSPDNLTGEISRGLRKHNWAVTEHSGSWVKGVSAGGPPISFLSEKFWSNPQFDLYIPPNKETTTVVISLMERDKLLIRSEAEISIGYAIFKIPEGRKPQRVTAENYGELTPRLVETSGVSWPYRERTCSFELESGNYVIAPYTHRPGQEAEFYMRIFAERSVDASPMEQPTNNTTEIVDNRRGVTPVPDRKPEKSLEILALDKAFDVASRRTGGIEAADLADVLRAGMESAGRPDTIRYSLETCRCLINLSSMQQTSGLIDREGLYQVWEDLMNWTKAFSMIDKNKSGTVDARELTELFQIIELSSAPAVVLAVQRRYGGKTGQLTEDDFLQAVSRVLLLNRMFVKLTREGQITASFDEWMTLGFAL